MAPLPEFINLPWQPFLFKLVTTDKQPNWDLEVLPTITFEMTSSRTAVSKYSGIE